METAIAFCYLSNFYRIVAKINSRQDSHETTGQDEIDSNKENFYGILGVVFSSLESVISCQPAGTDGRHEAPGAVDCC